MRISIIQKADPLGEQRTVHRIEVRPCRPVVGDKDREQALLEWLFRQLNRVDGSELISILGLHMPSLSVGDLVHVEDCTGAQALYLCDSVGWKRVVETGLPPGERKEFGDYRTADEAKRSVSLYRPGPASESVNAEMLATLKKLEVQLDLRFYLQDPSMQEVMLQSARAAIAKAERNLCSTNDECVK